MTVQYSAAEGNSTQTFVERKHTRAWNQKRGKRKTTQKEPTPIPPLHARLARFLLAGCGEMHKDTRRADRRRTRRTPSRQPMSIRSGRVRVKKNGQQTNDSIVMKIETIAINNVSIYEHCVCVKNGFLRGLTGPIMIHTPRRDGVHTKTDPR